MKYLVQIHIISENEFTHEIKMWQNHKFHGFHELWCPMQNIALHDRKILQCWKQSLVVKAPWDDFFVVLSNWDSFHWSWSCWCIAGVLQIITLPMGLTNTSAWFPSELTLSLSVIKKGVNLSVELKCTLYIYPPEHHLQCAMHKWYWLGMCWYQIWIPSVS